MFNMDKYTHFLEAKEKAINLLNKAKRKNNVDFRIEQILDLINKHDKFYTSSSCSGRIVLIELPKLGDKKGATFLGKWHEPIKQNEIVLASKKGKNGMLWLLAQSPILHIASETNNAADNLLKIAISCGFKNSGLKSITGKIIIEICSTERLDAPIGENSTLFCNDEYLNLLVEISNEIINRSNDKIQKFKRQLKNFID